MDAIKGMNSRRVELYLAVEVVDRVARSRLITRDRKNSDRTG